jgi:beta-glucanase (GH16 family)
MPNSGTGAWPAFWLGQVGGIPPTAPGTLGEELDIFEWYGVSHNDKPGLVQQASHNWNPDGTQDQTLPFLYKPQTPIPDGGQPWADFHIYGLLIDPAHITWNIDGVQTNQIATPTTHMTSAFYIMIDYALGGGWPLTGMVNNSSFDVDWVRVYAPPSTPALGINHAAH